MGSGDFRRVLAAGLWFAVATAECDHVEQVPGVLLAPPFGSVPSVILSYPSTGTPNIASTRQLYVEFNQDMDAESAQSAFSLTGSSALSGRYEWQGFRRLVYQLESDLPAGNAYVMRIGSTAKSKENAAMSLDYIVHFTVGNSIQSPTVVSTTPAASAQGVAVNTAVTFVFSRPMDPVSTQTAFSLSPSASGTFSWNPDNTSFTYQPSGALSAGTTYTAFLSTAAKDNGGVALGGSVSVSFQVGNDLVKPTVTSVTEMGNPAPMANNQAGVYKDSTFQIAFSEPMEAVGTRNAVLLTKLSDSSTVSMVSSWNSAFTQLTVNPVDALEPTATYRLTVSTSARDVSNNALQSPLTLTFTVNNSAGAANSEYLTILSASKTSPSVVESVSVANTGVLNTLDIFGGPAMRIEFTFSRPLDLSTVGDNIFITKILGSCTSPTITGISFRNQAPYTNNVLRLDFSGMSTCEYELKLLGTRSEIKSAVVASETGTWMREDMKVYIKGR